MSTHNALESMDPSDSKPKHRLFLCHSGAQKGFVEQLDKDLRSVDRDPFFDKDRDSLPIGDNFPSRIFKAIGCCQVGVVFLSEEFFMKSHWPMVEVVKMVECGIKVMPIFLGISPEDLSNKEKLGNWKLKWESWVKVKRGVDVAKWEGTLKHLRIVNGLVYKHADGEVKFREEIVKEVCKIVPPCHVWDDSHVQGKSRLSKYIQEKILATPISKKGVRVVGLYGVGGIGKTTACKSLCKDLDLEFDGRVCHIEFGDGTSERDRVQEVLKRLTSTNKEFLKDQNVDKCWSRLKDLLRLNKVGLTLDNVSTKSEVRDEAKKYLRLEYGKGSFVMVTARGLGELEYVGVKTNNCFPMLELVDEEARALFLYHAEVKNELDVDVVMKCISQCHFRKGDRNCSMHYHPLTLKVLGCQLVGKPPTKWESQLEDGDVFNQLGENENEVFKILRRSFDDLKVEYQMLFMDVALFDDGKKAWEGGYFIATIPREELSWCTTFEWLSMVHGVSVDEVERRLDVLKKRSLLEELGDGRSQIGMHDLWREFAVMKTSHEENSRWLYDEGTLQCAKSCMSVGGWKNLRRISIVGIPYHLNFLSSINFNKCSKVAVLRLEYIHVENGVLDLSPLKSIKSLELRQDAQVHLEHEGVEVVHQEVIGIGQLLTMTTLSWHSSHSQDLSAIEEISRLTNLRVLHLELRIYNNLPLSLDIQRLKHLQDVRVSIESMVSISGFGSEMKDLRILNLRWCSRLTSCTSVGDVVSLKELSLSLCNELEELPNLQKLKRLQLLNIERGCSLKPLRGWEGLGVLGSLVSLRCLKLQHLDWLRRLGTGVDFVKDSCCDWSLPNLRILTVEHCSALEVIDLSHFPQLRSFTLREDFGIDGWTTGSVVKCHADLVHLKNIHLEWLGLRELPDLGKFFSLQLVDMRRCSKLGSLTGYLLWTFVPAKRSKLQDTKPESTRGFGYKTREHPWVWIQNQRAPVGLDTKPESTRGFGYKTREHPWVWIQNQRAPVGLDTKPESTRGFGYKTREHPWVWIQNQRAPVGLDTKPESTRGFGYKTREHPWVWIQN